MTEFWEFRGLEGLAYRSNDGLGSSGLGFRFFSGLGFRVAGLRVYTASEVRFRV